MSRVVSSEIPKASGSRLTSSNKRPASKAKPAPERREPAHGYVAGDLVSHPLFGDGAVTAIDDDKLTIDFVDRGVKQIVHDYVERRMP
jgi:hypothetical protein